MLNILEALKTIYKNDQYPFADNVTPKDLVLCFPALDLTIETDQVKDDTFSLEEILCSESDLVFGTCTAAKIKFTIADVEQDLTGLWFTINQVIEGYDPVPLGKFKVDSCIKEDDLRYKDIIAYNALAYMDIDVASWYNSIYSTGEEVYTLKQFRESLLTYLNIEYDNETLPNDSMTVEKTIDTSRLSAYEVLRCCVELQGGFGQINRQGKFYHRVLKPAYGDYPTIDYPTMDYPIAANDTSYVMPGTIAEAITNSMCQTVRFEDYTVKEIDKLIIRTDEDDIGAIVGTGSNTYIIQGNFLVFGKTANELEQIARNAFSNMDKRPYKPFTADIIGLPYIEVGDYLEFANGIRGYVLQRALTGIQALRDEISAPGSKEREQNFGVNNEIIQLKGKTTRIKKDVEGVRVEVENLEESTNTRFEQTDQAISAEAVRAINAETELSGRLDVMAGKIVLKVDANGNVAAVELDADPSQGTNIKIKADNIQLEGLVTANGNFKVLPDGSIEAINGKFSGNITSSIINGGTITGSIINGGVINGAKLISIDDFDSTIIENGKINTSFIQLKSGSTETNILSSGIGYYDSANGNFVNIGSGGIQVGTNSNINARIYPDGEGRFIYVTCTYLNGYTPITSGNIGNQSVLYATSAGTAVNASKASNADYATDAGHAAVADSAPLPLAWKYAIQTNVGYLASQLGVSLPASWPA